MKSIKDLSDERIVEKLQEWHDKMLIIGHNTVNPKNNGKYLLAARNYNRYVLEWSRRNRPQK
jgi:hypothetical protein